jgi:glucose uptake protein GlcU
MLAAWNAMSRQKRVGWLILIISVGYALFFVKTRLFGTGPEIARKEWLYFILTFVGMMLGTINLRMAEMRERNQKTFPLAAPNQPAKK